MTLESYIAAMPKIELHVHLEGATQPETLLKIAERNGIKLPYSNVEALREAYSFRNFDDFLKIYLMVVGTLRTQQDFADLAYEFGSEMARQNIWYAEATFSPQPYIYHFKLGLSYNDILEAVNDGRARAKAQWGVEMRWIPDLVRSTAQATQLEMAQWACSNTARDGGVVALGLGGPEIGYPPQEYEEAFTYARQHNLPSNPHAGETAGPESIWNALKVLGANRIGHGVSATQDPALIDYLVEHQTPLEVNPTSNLCLKLYPSYAEHPLKQLLEAGCIVTINSDDPPMFNTTLTDEYLHAVQDCGLSRAALEKTVLDAIQVSYLPQAEKNALSAKFERACTALRAEHGL